MDKVQGGTPKGTESLCSTCMHAFIARGMNAQELIICGAMNRGIRITCPIVHCHKYQDKRLPDLGSMKEIAWVIHSRKRGPMGFAGDSDDLITISPPNRNVQYSDPVEEKESGEDKDG